MTNDKALTARTTKILVDQEAWRAALAEVHGAAKLPEDDYRAAARRLGHGVYLHLRGFAREEVEGPEPIAQLARRTAAAHAAGLVAPPFGEATCLQGPATLGPPYARLYFVSAAPGSCTAASREETALHGVGLPESYLSQGAVSLPSDKRRAQWLRAWGGAIARAPSDFDNVFVFGGEVPAQGPALVAQAHLQRTWRPGTVIAALPIDNRLFAEFVSVTAACEGQLDMLSIPAPWVWGDPAADYFATTLDRQNTRWTARWVPAMDRFEVRCGDQARGWTHLLHSEARDVLYLLRSGDLAALTRLVGALVEE